MLGADGRLMSLFSISPPALVSTFSVFMKKFPEDDDEPKNPELV